MKIDMVALEAAVQDAGSSVKEVGDFAALQERVVFPVEAAPIDKAVLPVDFAKAEEIQDPLIAAHRARLDEVYKKAWSAAEDVKNATAAYQIAKLALASANAELAFLMDAIGGS